MDNGSSSSPPRRASDRSIGRRTKDEAPRKEQSLPSTAPVQPPTTKGTSRRDFLRRIAIAGAGIAAAPLTLSNEEPAEASGPTGSAAASGPGGPRSWQGGVSIYKGEVNLATGNAHIIHAITGWGGRGGGLSMTLHYSSQSIRTGPLGPKWTHSLNCFIDTTSPDFPVVVEGDGTENSYQLMYGSYMTPVGVHDTLSKNADSTWKLTRKGGVVYNFTSTGALTSIVDTNGNTISFSYSGGLLTLITDAAGRTLQLGYSGSQLTLVTDPLNHEWQLSYDGSGRLSAVSDPALDGVTYSTNFGYDSYNNLTSAQDKLGKTWQYNHSSAGVLLGATDPDQNAWSNSYVNQQAPPTGVSSTSGWVDPSGNTLQHGFDSMGLLRTRTNPLQQASNFGYDGSFNRTSEQSPSGATWQHVFDSYGNKTSSTDPLGNQNKATYGTYDLVLTQTDPAGKQTVMNYDSAGNMTSLTDKNNKVWQYAPDSTGFVTQITDPLNRVTQFDPDAYGNVAQITDPAGKITQRVFNLLGQITQQTDALGNITNYTHDDWGRLTLIEYPTTGAPSVSFSYDAENRVIQSVDGTGTRTYSHDAWGRRIAMTDPRGNTSAVYDATGRISQQTDVSGRTIQYAFNTASQLTAVGDNTGSAQYTYTLDGDVATATYPNGTRVENGYDNARRVNSIVHRLISNGSIIISYGVSYDTAGRIYQVVEQPSGDVTTYLYDDAGHLTSEARTGASPYSGTYQYDGSGARVSAYVVTNGVEQQNGTYSYDTAGRLSQVVDTVTNTTDVYTWNDDGTLASFPGPGYTRLLAYNDSKQLVSITRDYGSGNQVLAYEYGYGADGGRRWKKDHAANIWTWYPCGVACSAGELVEQQSDLSGQNWTTTVLYLAGRAIVRRGGEYHHWDYRRTAGVITDGSGNVLSNDVFDRFGLMRYSSGSAQTPWRWSSGMEEGVDGDPSVFMTSDGTLFSSKSSASSADGASGTQSSTDPCSNMRDDCTKSGGKVVKFYCPDTSKWACYCCYNREVISACNKTITYSCSAPANSGSGKGHGLIYCLAICGAIGGIEKGPFGTNFGACMAKCLGIG